ncbi:MAG: TetR family transcriptional regulator, partial [Pseudomonadota bacterium]
MNSPTRFKAPREDRQLTILETTLRLIAESGVDAITHRKVAAAADIPLGSTTYYFESREHLIRAAFDHYLQRIRALSAEAASGSQSTGKDLIDFLVTLSHREFEDPALLRAEYEMTLYATRDPVLAAALNAWYEEMIEQMAATLKMAGAKAPQEAARAVLHMMRGYELERLTNDTETE